MRKSVVKYGIDEPYNIYEVQEKVLEINNSFALGTLVTVLNEFIENDSINLPYIFIKAKSNNNKNIKIDVISFRGNHKQIFFFNMIIKEL